jgi:O-methyltransferase involved in polyketide biosynthesis
MQRPQATAFASLRSRAYDAEQADSRLRDDAARELARSLGVQYAGIDGDRVRAYLTRTATIDRWVRAVLASSLAATVVDLGAGLDTRFERVDDGHVHWIDVDLHDVVLLRRRLLRAGSRRTHLATAGQDTHWLREARRAAATCCVVMQGVLAYLPADAIDGLFIAIADTFDRATVLVDFPRSWQHETVVDLARRLQLYGRGWEIADAASLRLVRLTTR